MKMKTISVLFLLLIGLLTVYGQNGNKSKLTDEEINELSSKLAMKLLLNDTQKSTIKNLLITYRIELEKINSGSGESTYKNKQELVSSLNSQIVSFLDSKQKMKFDVLEKEWWASVDAEEND
jgi:signal recognition particle GTPase